MSLREPNVVNPKHRRRVAIVIATTLSNGTHLAAGTTLTGFANVEEDYETVSRWVGITEHKNQDQQDPVKNNPKRSVL